jgi:hypothetical protein
MNWAPVIRWIALVTLFGCCLVMVVALVCLAIEDIRGQDRNQDRDGGRDED